MQGSFIGDAGYGRLNRVDVCLLSGGKLEIGG